MNGDKLTLSTVLQDSDSLADVSKVESCLVVTAHVLSDLSYTDHTNIRYTGRERTNPPCIFRQQEQSLTNLHHLA